MLRPQRIMNEITGGFLPNLQISFLFILTLISCTENPMAPARKDIEIFKKNHNSQMGIHQGIHRKISYAFAGNPAKRPVIFIHGSPGSREAWYSYLLKKELTENFHLIVPDRPGYGDSGKGISEPSLKKQSEDMWSLMSLNTSGLTPILVGHSYGAPVIARMAMDRSDVHALILVAGSIDPELEDDMFIQKVGRLPLIRSLIPDFLRVCNEEITALKSELQKIDFDWKKIKSRVYAIHGHEDDLVPSANIDFLKRMIPDSRITMINSNHFIPWKNPETITEILFQEK